jgi:hypothetical protein
MDTSYLIQKAVFTHCDKLSDSHFIELVDSFVFGLSYTTEGVVGDFIDKMECRSSYIKHIEDLEKGERRYILKCSGSELYFIEDLKTALLASSYNRFKRDVGNK